MPASSMTRRLRLLGDRRFRLLLCSLAVSSCRDWLYNVALLALVFDRTGSATWSRAPPRRECSRSWSSVRSGECWRTVTTVGDC
ncbi:MAG: hypothetical protein JOZ95_26350 [Solirubrobacterales bacterium]|nr:hypothetical protein [Solirubrobacterales bacterium]